MEKRIRSNMEQQVDREIIAEGKNVLKSIDKSQGVEMPAKKRDSKLISIRLPKDMIARLRAVAVRKGNIGYQQLIKTYLDEALTREELTGKLQNQFIEATQRGELFVWTSGQPLVWMGDIRPGYPEASPVSPQWYRVVHQSVDDEQIPISHNNVYSSQQRETV